ncbi:MAG: hypothetical protein AVDCRST_MAG41-1778, partial [uncultured Corynebacteriales bacterium]
AHQSDAVPQLWGRARLRDAAVRRARIGVHRAGLPGLRHRPHGRRGRAAAPTTPRRARRGGL